MMSDVGMSGCWRRTLDSGFVNGEWIAAKSGETFTVHDPATGRTLSEVPDMGEEDAHDAIEAAKLALSGWGGTTAKHRSKILRRWFELIEAHAETLARLMTAEQGKPLIEARGEVIYGASFVEWFSEEAKRAYGRTIPPDVEGTHLAVEKQPVGVCALITPWNFPVAMITRKAAPALAAGCSVVVKPAEATPLCALALADLAKEAGVPDGVLNVITSSRGDRVGPALTDSPIVRKLSFTGSTTVGKRLLQACAGTVKRVSLELGGNAPFIVFDDADLDAAVDGLMASKFRNTGQTCVCANRIFVHESVYGIFAEKLAAKVAGLQVGDGRMSGVDQGPLINQTALEKVQYLVNDALACGGVVAQGGRPHSLGGSFFDPTVLTNINSRMRIAQEEIFGPVAPLIAFDTVEDVIDQANDTPFGLAAYFYSQNSHRQAFVSQALEYGMVGINTGSISNEVAPFGGVKESGLGREGGLEGLEEYLATKYVCRDSVHG